MTAASEGHPSDSSTHGQVCESLVYDLNLLAYATAYFVASLYLTRVCLCTLNLWYQDTL